MHVDAESGHLVPFLSTDMFVPHVLLFHIVCCFCPSICVVPGLAVVPELGPSGYAGEMKCLGRGGVWDSVTQCGTEASNLCF